jgi:hypothetical protein
VVLVKRSIQVAAGEVRAAQWGRAVTAETVIPHLLEVAGVEPEVVPRAHQLLEE